VSDSIWGQIGDFAADAAPALATALGGPAAGGAAKLVASAFGGKSDKPEDLLERVQQDPEAAAKLKRIETQHKERLEELALEGEKARLQAGSAEQGAVNETIREGYRQGVLWRRALGWSFALAAPATLGVALYVILQAVNRGDAQLIEMLGPAIGALSPIFYVYLLTLGVIGNHEGKMGRLMAGEESGKKGLMSKLAERVGGGGKG
jgi:hypothetical protein